MWWIGLLLMPSSVSSRSNGLGLLNMKNMICELCKKEFETPDNIPRTVDGRSFCCEDHEQKWLSLYSKWIETTYSERKYEPTSDILRE